MRYRGWMTVAVLCLAPVLPWTLAHPLTVRFATPASGLKSLANLAALVGTAAFAVALILGSRLRVVERLFLGLDRMYRAHRSLGLVAVSLVILHAVLLVLSRALRSWGAAWTLFTPGAGWRVFVGVVALAGLVAGLALTLFVRMRHETFVRVQRSLGIVFLVASVHVFVVPGTKASSRPLTVYLALLTALALAAFARRSLLGRLLARRYRYRVQGVNRLAPDAVEIVLVPEGDGLRFQPGQFVFVRFVVLGGEAHPFSITSVPAEAALRLVVKALGDYTGLLLDLPPGGRPSWRDRTEPSPISPPPTPGRCGSPAASASRRFSAWPEAWTAPATRSTCTTARPPPTRPTSWRSSSTWPTATPASGSCPYGKPIWAA